MNKYYHFAVCLLALAGMAFSKGSLHVGGGLNISSSNSEEEDGVTLSPRFGFNAGLGYELMFNETFSLLPGLSLETRGENAEISFTDPFSGSTFSTEGKAKLLYLQVPVLAMLNFPAGNMLVNVFAGPEMGINLSYGVEVDGKDLPDDELSDIKTIDFGLAVGAGLAIPAGTGSITVRPSYYLGLTEVTEDDSATPENEAEGSKMRNIKIEVGYNIPLGG